MLLKITTLPGDGIGPEVTEQAVHVLQAIADSSGHRLKVTEKNIGGAALVASNDPLPADTISSCLDSGAVLLGAVGGPAFDSYPAKLRPEAGLLRLRSQLGVFANLRPAICLEGLEALSPLRQDIVHGTDVMIVRELLGDSISANAQPKVSPGAAALSTLWRIANPRSSALPALLFNSPGSGEKN